MEQGYDLLRRADAHTSHLPSGVAGAGAFWPPWPAPPAQQRLRKKRLTG